MPRRAANSSRMAGTSKDLWESRARAASLPRIGDLHRRRPRRVRAAARPSPRRHARDDRVSRLSGRKASDDAVRGQGEGDLAEPHPLGALRRLRSRLDFLYLTPAKSRLFAALPELELAPSFSMRKAREMIGAVASRGRRSLIEERLRQLEQRVTVSDTAY